MVLRSVCDAAEEALPFDMNLCADEHGSVDRSKVLRYALLHPVVIGPLWEMRRRVSHCSEQLARTVSTLLEQNAGEEPR